MSRTAERFEVLRRVADPDAVAAMEDLVREGSDRSLHRINVLEFAEAHGLHGDRAIGAFLHAAQLGLFDMSWNLLCEGCGGVLEANSTLQDVRVDEYNCSLCGGGYRPTLDEMVEVSFTVSPGVRQIAAHDPDSLPLVEYKRQIYWSSGIRLPEGEAFEELLSRILIDAVELPAGERAVRSVELPTEFVIVFDPVSHVAQFIEVAGEPTEEVQEISVVLAREADGTEPVTLRPGPLELTLDNRMDRRALPGVFIAGDDLHELLGRRRPFLTATRLFTNQTFRDIHRTGTLSIDQSLRITSLTFVFTDLRGSTSLYERIGDLAAFDLVKAHFRALQEVVADESGAVVKTIGDAVMATFSGPDRALSACLRMREAIRAINAGAVQEELMLKIGIHEGPCLAVTLNDRLDYFGQTVNIASRVQGLASSHSIFATEPVVRHPQATRLLEKAGLIPARRHYSLRGISDSYPVFEIPWE